MILTLAICGKNGSKKEVILMDKKKFVKLSGFNELPFVIDINEVYGIFKRRQFSNNPYFVCLKDGDSIGLTKESYMILCEAMALDKDLII